MPRQATIDGFGWAIAGGKQRTQPSADALLAAATKARKRTSLEEGEDAALLKVGIKRIKNVGQGNCGYLALADGLREIAGITVTADELRANALAEMRLHPREYAHGAHGGDAEEAAAEEEADTGRWLTREIIHRAASRYPGLPSVGVRF